MDKTKLQRKSATPHNERINRRRFIKKATRVAIGAISFPYIISSSALGKAGNVSPSEHITLGCIGTGWQGTSNIRSFLAEKDCQIIAVCDVDKGHLNNAVNIVNSRYGNSDCAAYNDFRALLARNDIDAVVITVPDHWHAVTAIQAVKSGKDIYGEKPLSHTFSEGLAICNVVKRYGRIWQTGTWHRSQSIFRFACELVLNGRIGDICRVEVGMPFGHKDYTNTANKQNISSPPEELDYDLWLGPAPYAPYCPARVHQNWRWHLDYGGGQLMDWIGHYFDIAQWGCGFDHTGPYEIEAQGEYPKDRLWNAPTKFHITAKYAKDITMIIDGGYSNFPRGTKWIGKDGWVYVDRERIDANPVELFKEKFGPDDIHLFRSPGHHRNFLDCVKTRQTPIATCEAAHRSVTPGHLGLIAMSLGRKIRFNPDTQEIIDDSTAKRLLGYQMRSPWRL